MSCQQIQEHLVLHLGGDLPAREAEAVEAHLAQCAACRDEALALLADLDWLRAGLGDAPFDEADRQALRQSVMAQLPRRAVPARLWRMVGGLAAAALVLLVLGDRTWRKRPNPRFLAAAIQQGPSVRMAPPAATVAPSEAPARPVAVRPATLASSRPAPEIWAPPEDMPSRIEFTTDQPGVRIIWLGSPASPSEEQP